MLEPFITDQVDLFVKQFSFWPHLSDSEKELVSQHLLVVQHPKGSSLHNGDDHCLGVVLLKSGQLRAYMLSDDGREITLYRLFPGETCVLSASCVLEAITFDVVIDVVEDSQLLVLPSSIFHQLCDSNIYVEAFSYKLATQRFSDVMWAMQQILFMGMDKRLAIFLLDEVAQTGTDQLKITHEQVAKYMGSAREVVSRTLKYFAAEGLVELSRGIIKVLDKQRLRQITQSTNSETVK